MNCYKHYSDGRIAEISVEEQKRFTEIINALYLVTLETNQVESK